ncbi:hypothetical protein EHW99_2962 [Erwinia amylovora]|uniref:Uncharacterized protein n=3 Tax=Erwinia amylovora TaxID=552 RepID=A0A830ZZ73_ERWAM|nr:hypothetical protein EaACW_0620 [Erwinia amylovora ACW56400]QJQ55661.1 hypothetical protein EHX00_2962 [Erwinia amylovora]CBA19565.1 hypothetical protein predicted by Glimmer/Critica [Erwinia amylovora CFBP1430]CBX79467.1 hypothetical protein predicted by Glimmer/Critica [Erwinia amylovora ATCC BAA-2158]CCO77468.1 hypothetical protein BN432_0637 [Erwinia amylovora Ea356]CCO81253.1 hypothetical protein BN433_0648 [Erwinia amylovora Ea266]CCO85059.1 hypothetical protein BN434_0638 [Erwinia a
MQADYAILATRVITSLCWRLMPPAKGFNTLFLLIFT